MKRLACVFSVLCCLSCKKDFGKEPDDGDAGPDAVDAVAAYCLKLRACFEDPRPLSACILLEARDTTVSPFLRPLGWAGDDPQDVLAGVDWWERFTETRKGCVERAATCAEAVLCGNSEGDTCDSTMWAPFRCRSGDDLEGCYGEDVGGYQIGVDCLQQKLDCWPNDAGGAACGIDNCIVEPVAPSCDGDALVDCQRGIVQRLECGQMGRTCGGADCRGTGADCDGTPDPDEAVHGWLYPMAPATCEGSAAVYCDAGGETRIDCGASDMLRACTEGAPGGCSPTGADCNPRDFVGECSEGRAQYCVDGRIAMADCAALGYAGCDMIAGAPGCVF